MRGLFAALAVASALVITFGNTTRARADEGASPAEIADARTEIGTTLAQMRASSLRVRDHLRLTRKRGTRAQITCVDEALSRSDVALRRARDLADETLAAYGRNDFVAARLARHNLAELREAQRLTAIDATKCTPAPPPPIAIPQGTTVKLEVDPRIAVIP
ncbi:MAG: hypothetical protein JWP87_957 [Labilithrix sp.]|nr:hypothetical protein [Labilithrix sp.]